MYVGDRELKSCYIWFTLLWCIVHQDGLLFSLEMVHGDYRLTNPLTRCDCLHLVSRQPPKSTFPNPKRTRPSNPPNKSEPFRHRAKKIQKISVSNLTPPQENVISLKIQQVHRSNKRSQNMDVLPTRLVPRNGKRTNESILIDHQLLRLYSLADDFIRMRYRGGCIHIPSYSSVAFGLYEGLFLLQSCLFLFDLQDY